MGAEGAEKRIQQEIHGPKSLMRLLRAAHSTHVETQGGTLTSRSRE